MKRLLLAVVLLSLFAPLSAMDDAAWAAMKKSALERPRRLIYDNDDDDLMHQQGGGEENMSVEKFLALRTSYLAGSDFNTMIMGATYGAFDNMIFHPENFGPGLRERIKGTYFEWLRNKGIDPIELEMDFARKNDIEFFVSVRFNDTHDAFSPTLFTPNKEKHPEWLFGKKDALPFYGAWSSYDFTFPAVRDMFVNTVREIVERYAVDGISIDIFRQPAIFRSVAYGGHASDEERENLLAMFRRIRAITDAAGRGRERPVLILVRLPDSVEYCHAIGLDLETLLKEQLVDLVVPSGDWRLNPWRYSVELCHKYGVKCYADMDMPEYNEPNNRLMRNANESHWAWQARALANGCDGTYWFNRFYQGTVKVLAKPDLPSLKFLSKRYHATERFLYYTPETHLRNGQSYMNMPFIHRTHPMELASNHPYDLLFEFGDDTAALQREGSAFDMTAYLMGRLPEPEKLQIVSNGVAWPFAGMEDDIYTYHVPADALKMGLNTITLTYTGRPGTASKEQIIMAGNELLQGTRQPPWRRLFTDCKAQGAGESIVDNAYRFADTGDGFTNLLYPLPPIPDKLAVQFTMKVESTSGGQGVVLRVADGRHVETIAFTEKEVACLNGGVKAALDTTAFHNYVLEMDEKEVRLQADGKALLAAPLAVSVDDMRAVLHGAVWQMDFAATRSLLVGSLDDKGGGVSLWKNLRINRQNGRTFLTDFAVETNIFHPLVKKHVSAWRVTRQGGSDCFFSSKPDWSSNPMVAEADVDLDKGPVRLAFSRGGDFIVLDVARDSISFPFNNVKSLKIKELNSIQTIHVQFDDTDRGQLFIGDFGCEFNAKNTTMGLQEEYFTALVPQHRSILRHGGFAVLPDAQGQRNEAAVVAMRSRLTPVGEGFPADKVAWKLTYDAAGEDLPGSEWQSTYLPQNMEIVDGADGKPTLRLTGSEMPQSQQFSLADPSVLNAWPGEQLAFECRMRYAGGMPEGQEDFFTFGIGGGEGGATGTLYVQLGFKKLAGNCGTIAYEGLEKGDYFILQAVVDKKTCAARFWIDGEPVGSRAAVPNPVQAPFFLWGKTGANHGNVEVSSLKVGSL